MGVCVCKKAKSVVIHRRVGRRSRKTKSGVLEQRGCRRRLCFSSDCFGDCERNTPPRGENQKPLTSEKFRAPSVTGCGGGQSMLRRRSERSSSSRTRPKHFTDFTDAVWLKGSAGATIGRGTDGIRCGGVRLVWLGAQ